MWASHTFEPVLISSAVRSTSDFKRSSMLVPSGAISLSFSMPLRLHDVSAFGGIDAITYRSKAPIMSFIPTNNEMTFLSLSRRFFSRVYTVLNARTTTKFLVISMDAYHAINSPPTNGCRAVNSSRAFMSIGIPSENISMPSFIALTVSVCSATATVVLMTGMNGAALLVVVTMSSIVQDQHIMEKE